MRREPEHLCSLVGYYTPAVSTAKGANSTGERDGKRMTATARSSMSMARAYNEDPPLLIKTGSHPGGDPAPSEILWRSMLCDHVVVHSLLDPFRLFARLRCAALHHNDCNECQSSVDVGRESVAPVGARLKYVNVATGFEKARHTGRIRGASPNAKLQPPTPNPYYPALLAP
jgi:hypothetical protein